MIVKRRKKMEESTERLIGYLNILGVRVDKNVFESRMKGQKLAYIIQKLLDVKLYDDFNFYIKGPYSPALAREYFANPNDFIKGNTDYSLTKTEVEKLEKEKPLLESLDNMKLEVVASLLYIREEDRLDENAAEQKLIARKPHLKREDIWRGTNIIKKLFLTEEVKDKLMKSLQDEMEDWEVLSNESLQRFE